MVKKITKNYIKSYLNHALLSEFKDFFIIILILLNTKNDTALQSTLLN
jgi:hypothetical protein